MPHLSGCSTPGGRTAAWWRRGLRSVRRELAANLGSVVGRDSCQGL